MQIRPLGSRKGLHAAIAQMVERLPCKQDVPSSILGGGTKLLLVSIVVMQSADNRLRGVQFTHEQPDSSLKEAEICGLMKTFPYD